MVLMGCPSHTSDASTVRVKRHNEMFQKFHQSQIEAGHVVVVLTLTRIIKSVVTGQAPVILELWS